MIPKIPLIILFSLSIAGLTGPLTVNAGIITGSNLLPLFEHPLIYHPSSNSIPGSPPYVPSDIRKGYDFNPLYARGINGTGTRIAIIDAFGNPTMSKDLSSFNTQTGLPAAALNIYYPDGVPAKRDSGWAVETALDVEWAHAIAPAATIDLVVAYDSGLGHVYDAISYVATHLTNETSLSMSFGLSESQYPKTGGLTISSTHQLFVTITSHGTTPFASSGDDGASTCCNVSYPASDSLVVGVGGTTLNLDSSANYLSETTWSGSGAGSSTVFAKPSWQQGLGDSKRDVSDVSYDADPNTGVLVVQGGFRYQVGGTSAGIPQLAGLAALASQAAGQRYGSMAAQLYKLSTYHDITGGSDGFFSAGPGWDYPTGMGTPDADLLVGSLTGPVVPLRSSNLFQGLNVTTNGTLQVNTSSLTMSGTATVQATNTTTGQLVYTRTYTIAGVRLQNMSTIETGRFLLNIPVNPYPLSTDITVTIQGTQTSVQADVTRQVNISGGGTVNIEDVGIVLADFNAVEGTPGYNPQADLGAVGTVNVTDLSIVDLYYNSPVFN